MPETAHELVARGAALLDEKLPDWADVIDLDRLDMSDPCHCVLGQIGTEVFNLDRFWHEAMGDPSPFAVIEDKYFIDLEEVGFEVAIDWEAEDCPILVGYDELQDAWKGEIVARRTL